MVCRECDDYIQFPHCDREHVDDDEHRAATCLYCDERHLDITCTLAKVVLKEQQRKHVDDDEHRAAICLYCGEQQGSHMHICAVVLKKLWREGGSE